ncbi:MAG: nickel pincer cofactor biosynthesis protein LarC [Planctomycetota bacterium]|nr:nickel pincer cofactor biosynthesis protein LarC [Planctomycetota bacterium]
MGGLLYIDPFSGASGDMFVGALLDLGVPLAAVRRELAKVDFGGYRIGTTRVMRGSVSGTLFDVEVAGAGGRTRSGDRRQRSSGENGRGDKPGRDPGRGHKHGDEDGSEGGRERSHGHGRAHGHNQDQGHDHEHGQGHEYGHEHGHGSAYQRGNGHEDERGHGQGRDPGHEHRSWTEIERLIKRSGLSEFVRRKSLEAFERLAEVEARIHGIGRGEVRFHEVGATDSLVDIIGTFAAIEALEPDEIMCGPVTLGSGTVRCDHGELPVPAPATIGLMRGIPIRPTDREGELTTPTGALLISSLASRFGPIPAMTVEKIGYGAGHRDDPGFPNVLRMVLGRRTALGTGTADSVVEMTANVDDSTPETLGFLHERLAAAGALDVFLRPVTMKKGRLGVEITVLCPEGAAGDVAAALFAETTTFGIRFCRKERLTLSRRSARVRTRFGTVRVKIGEMGGRVISVSPEYEDCRLLATKKNVPLRRVYSVALAAAGREIPGLGEE